MKKISVIGFGSWGIALANVLCGNGHDVFAWDGNAEYVEELLKTRRNNYLPQVVIPSSIKITADVEIAANHAEIFVLAMTSKAVSAVAPVFASYFNAEKIVVNGAKGLEETKQIRISEYLRSLNNDCRFAALTGPSHAEEVLKNIPTAVVAASEDKSVATAVQAVFSSENFRVYTSSDLIGAEIGGALKNVIALAAGCSDGLGFGDNSKAALITRGVAEISRLGVKMGAKEQTFAGLSGMGDLIVTCTSKHSRNWRAGFSLAQGNSLDETLKQIGMVVEGVGTAKTALQLARKHNTTMPIIEEINKILFENKNPKTAVTDLMLREQKNE
ncbi:MAG: NAD(P)-dependent glycerol-3-phosphate dehydrogenase [Defluviitaleaceae bacterium]|nr:NAD(P)-dependent glycerol-3-phosphate dehydrogenase [Defluviitaleaceae bacterium]